MGPLFLAAFARRAWLGLRVRAEAVAGAAGYVRRPAAEAARRGPADPRRARVGGGPEPAVGQRSQPWRQPDRPQGHGPAAGRCAAPVRPGPGAVRGGRAGPARAWLAFYAVPVETFTFLFTDIEGSTALLGRVGQGVYARVLAGHHAIIRSGLAAHGGREVDTQGDAFFAVFSSPAACLAAVIQMQQALQAHAWPGGEQVRVRMGVHTGQASATAAGLVGLDVHRAARVAAAGHGGQVLVSEASAALVGEVLPPGRGAGGSGGAPAEGPGGAGADLPAAGGGPASRVPAAAHGAGRGRGGHPDAAPRPGLVHRAAAGAGASWSRRRRVRAGWWGFTRSAGWPGSARPRSRCTPRTGWRPRFPAGQIFLPLHGHTPGQQPVDPADALASLLLTAGVPAGQIPPGLEARMALWRDRLAEQQLLLILDDAASSEQVRPLLPGTGGSLVLVTSRRHLSALEDATAVSLDTLPPRRGGRAAGPAGGPARAEPGRSGGGRDHPAVRVPAAGDRDGGPPAAPPPGLVGGRAGRRAGRRAWTGWS